MRTKYQSADIKAFLNEVEQTTVREQGADARKVERGQSEVTPTNSHQGPNSG
jgi:hypothetical protein